MLKRGSGHVINVSATVADYANSTEPAVLPALTKGGLASATRSLAIEYASRGIRVNAVSPANIQTPVHAPETYDTLAGMIPARPGGPDQQRRQCRLVPGAIALHHRRDRAHRRRPYRRSLNWAPSGPAGLAGHDLATSRPGRATRSLLAGRPWWHHPGQVGWREAGTPPRLVKLCPVPAWDPHGCGDAQGRDWRLPGRCVRPSVDLPSSMCARRSVLAVALRRISRLVIDRSRHTPGHATIRSAVALRNLSRLSAWRQDRPNQCHSVHEPVYEPEADPADTESRPAARAWSTAS